MVIGCRLCPYVVRKTPNVPGEVLAGELVALVGLTRGLNADNSQHELTFIVNIKRSLAFPA